jgi:hypothetical protein
MSIACPSRRYLSIFSAHVSQLRDSSTKIRQRGFFLCVRCRRVEQRLDIAGPNGIARLLKRYLFAIEVDFDAGDLHSSAALVSLYLSWSFGWMLVIGHAYPATDPHRVRSLKGFDNYSVTQHPDP